MTTEAKPTTIPVPAPPAPWPTTFDISPETVATFRKHRDEWRRYVEEGSHVLALLLEKADKDHDFTALASAHRYGRHLEEAAATIEEADQQVNDAVVTYNTAVEKAQARHEPVAKAASSAPPHQHATARRLRLKQISRVDLVDEGANFDKKTGEGSHIMLYKSASPPQETAEQRVDRLLAEVNRTIERSKAERQKPITIESKEDTPVDKTAFDGLMANVRKSMHTPAQRAEAVEKIAKAATDEAGSYDEYSRAVTVPARVRATSGSGDVTAEVMKRVTVVVAKSTTKLTLVDAIEQVFADDPELYEAYRNGATV